MSLHKTLRTQAINQPYLTPEVIEALIGITKAGMEALAKARAFMYENTFIDHVFIRNATAPLFSYVLPKDFKGEISQAYLGIQHGSLVLKLVESTTDTVIFCDFGPLDAALAPTVETYQPNLTPEQAHNRAVWLDNSQRYWREA